MDDIDKESIFFPLHDEIMRLFHESDIKAQDSLKSDDTTNPMWPRNSGCQDLFRQDDITNSMNEDLESPSQSAQDPLRDTSSPMFWWKELPFSARDGNEKEKMSFSSRDITDWSFDEDPVWNTDRVEHLFQELTSPSKHKDQLEMGNSFSPFTKLRLYKRSSTSTSPETSPEPSPSKSSHSENQSDVLGDVENSEKDEDNNCRKKLDFNAPEFVPKNVGNPEKNVILGGGTSIVYNFVCVNHPRTTPLPSMGIRSRRSTMGENASRTFGPDPSSSFQNFNFRHRNLPQLGRKISKSGIERRKIFDFCSFCRDNGLPFHETHCLRNPITKQIICPELNGKLCVKCGEKVLPLHKTENCPKSVQNP